MFAIVDVGGKQYRAEVGREIVVDRLQAAEGDTVEFNPTLISGDEVAVAAGDSAAGKVTAKVVEHFRGPKLRIFKYKPKRGYRRKTGFRSELTRLLVESID